MYREYYSNPSRDTNTTYDHVGGAYVYKKYNLNYMINIHYFTTMDYNNANFIKELDDTVGKIIKTSTRNIF